MAKKCKIEVFRKQIESTYSNSYIPFGDFGEIICYELHSQPINPRMNCKTSNKGNETGLTFRELADKWDITTEFLGELIADHCKKL